MSSGSRSFADAVELLVPAKEDLVVDERRRGVEPVVERVLREHLERRSGANHERRAFASGDIDAPRAATGDANTFGTPSSR